MRFCKGLPGQEIPHPQSRVSVGEELLPGMLMCSLLMQGGSELSVCHFDVFLWAANKNGDEGILLIPFKKSISTERTNMELYLLRVWGGGHCKEGGREFTVSLLS